MNPASIELNWKEGRSVCFLLRAHTWLMHQSTHYLLQHVYLFRVSRHTLLAQLSLVTASRRSSNYFPVLLYTNFYTLCVLDQNIKGLQRHLFRNNNNNNNSGRRNMIKSRSRSTLNYVIFWKHAIMTRIYNNSMHHYYKAIIVWWKIYDIQMNWLNINSAYVISIPFSCHT